MREAKITKAERLVRMISMLAGRERWSVGRLQRHFRVSERTVYRDLQSLSRFGIRVLHDKGYHIRVERASR